MVVWWSPRFRGAQFGSDWDFWQRCRYALDSTSFSFFWHSHATHRSCKVFKMSSSRQLRGLSSFTVSHIQQVEWHHCIAV